MCACACACVRVCVEWDARRPGNTNQSNGFECQPLICCIVHQHLMKSVLSVSPGNKAFIRVAACQLLSWITNDQLLGFYGLSLSTSLPVPLPLSWGKLYPPASIATKTFHCTYSHMYPVNSITVDMFFIWVYILLDMDVFFFYWSHIVFLVFVSSVHDRSNYRSWKLKEPMIIYWLINYILYIF